MLADYQLDTEQFSDIMEDARNMAVSLFPQWTDFNYHDPGITMLELFSWIKEGQQYFLDQIGTEHKKKYLKLLGISPRRRTPAETFVNIYTNAPVSLPKGTQLGAGTVPFETVRRQYVGYNRILCCFHGRTELENTCIGGNIEDNKSLHLPIFGLSPQYGDSWYIGFERAFPIGETVGIHISLVDELEDKKRRNPISEPMFAPLLKLAFEYYADGEWRHIEDVEDNTYGMLQSGMLYISVMHGMERRSVFGETAYFVRVRVEKSDIDIPPVLERIRMNMVFAVQEDTWAQAQEAAAFRKDGRYSVRVNTYAGLEGANDLYLKIGDIYYPIAISEKYIRGGELGTEWLFDADDAGDNPTVLVVSYMERPRLQKCLGIGNGMPYQEMELPAKDILYESVEILVNEIGSGGGFSRWKRVLDFGASTPEDRHFMVDTENGKICFGDCEHGMAPEGSVILISFVETRGAEGNVTHGTLDVFPEDEEAEGAIFIHSAQDAYGGMEEETIEECFFRARKLLKTPQTAVTNADYERHVMETPGLLIDGCKVIPAEDEEKNTLAIVVKPVCFNEKKALSEAYRQNILAYLEQYRMLGTNIELLTPRCIYLDIAIEAEVRPHFLQAREIIYAAVRDYFAAYQKQFGAVIVYSDLYGAIDRLDCVAAVNDLTLDVRDGNVKRTRDGNLILPPNGIIELNQIQCVMPMSPED